MTPTQRRAAAAAMATAIAVPCEGLRRIAYYDPPGILTVCTGHTGAGVVKGKTYSLAECDAFLTDDMRKALDTVERCQPGLPVPILAAFGDAVFNMGPTIACSKTNSTAARKLALRDYRGACEQLPRWDKARVMGVMVSLPGLTKRRGLERDLCMEGI